jgi:hypothetical protein
VSNLYWSRAKVGKDRVYWFAMEALTSCWWSYNNNNIIGEGYVKSFEEAEHRAILVAGFGVTRIGCHAALSRHKELVREERAKKGAKRSEANIKEYLYYGDLPTRYAHLVLKKTRRRYYVTRQSLPVEWLGTDKEKWENPYHDSDVVVDRAAIEKSGSVYSRRLYEYLYLRLEDLTVANRDTIRFPSLGLTGDFTEQDLRQAYRSKAKEVHPDRGGSTMAFCAVEEEYRQAMRMFSR